MTRRARKKVTRNASEIARVTKEIGRKFDRLASLLRAKRTKKRLPAGSLDRIAQMTMRKLRKQGVIKPDESRVRQLARQAVSRELLKRRGRRY